MNQDDLVQRLRADYDGLPRNVVLAMRQAADRILVLETWARMCENRVVSVETKNAALHAARG